MVNYSPNYLNSAQLVIESHQAAIKGLLGKSLTESWVVWELNENGWFNDAPIVLNFEGTRLELNYFGMSELSITFNTLSLSEKLNWYGLTNLDLVWREDSLKELVAVKGLHLKKVEVAEFLFETEVVQNRNTPELVGQKDADWLLSGLSFWFDEQHVSIHNGLDENAISFERPEGYNFRYHKVTV